MDGTGFIWVNGYISPDNTKISIEGCIWAYPYQIKIFDPTNPIALPYPTIFETNIDNEYSEVIGWKNNKQFEYKNNHNEIIVKEI